MDGVLIVDKPEGLTSADVVRIAKRSLRVKVGHLGTLDPFATGVLPLCLGEGTKIAQFLNVADKIYTGRIRLGTDTDSGDRTGQVIRRAPVPEIDATRTGVVARRFIGEQLQTPPMYSAVKQGGIPLYKFARAGKEVERTPRAITVYRLELHPSGAGAMDFEVHCSKGTYVRVLAQEVAAALGSAGHLESLRRTAFGGFTLREASTIADLEAGRCHGLLDLRVALGHLREIAIDAGCARRACQGQEAALRDLPPATPEETAKLIGPTGNLVAVVSAGDQRRWRFERVFAGATASS